MGEFTTTMRGKHTIFVVFAFCVVAWFNEIIGIIILVIDSTNIHIFLYYRWLPPVRLTLDGLEVKTAESAICNGKP